MPRPTTRGFSLLGLSAGSYVAARALGAWELYFFAFSFAAVVIFVWLWAFLQRNRVSAYANISPEAHLAGEEPQLDFFLENRSIFPGPRFTLTADLEGITDNDLDLEVESLGPRTQCRVSAGLGRAERGKFLLPPVESTYEDILGITYTPRPVTGELRLTVYPRLAQLNSCVFFPESGRRKNEMSGAGLSASMGALEFYGVRPHQPGEPLNHIDWKNTAKTGVMMVRESEEPAAPRITVLLDGSESQVAGEPPNTNYELAVRVAGSIADFALRSGKRVALIRHEEEWRERLFLPTREGRKALLETLAEAKSDAPEPLLEALKKLGRLSRTSTGPKMVTVVSMSLDRHLVQSLADLRREGMQPSFVYIPRRSFELLSAPGRSRERSLQPNGSSVHSLTTEEKALLLTLRFSRISTISLDWQDNLMEALSTWNVNRETNVTTSDDFAQDAVDREEAA